MLYPIKFEPILKEIIWGGDEICRFKGIQPARSGIGESWEVSHVKNNVSVVAHGALKGKSLEELIDAYGEKLLGKKVIDRFGTTFPLLIKFIDARDSLSIQVHPDDELARKRHNSFGKTEMWYIVNASQDAFLYSGFAKAITAEEYVESVKNDTFIHYLQRHEAQPGDVFFLPAGRVHAIGAGCFIAEIQQTSDITYRIYDYNRKDAQGNPRELHTEPAKEAIDYKVYSNYKLDYVRKQGDTPLISCPYFTTHLIDIRKGETLAFDPEADSFHIYICLEGKAQFIDNSHGYYTDEMNQGETFLFPAESRQISLTAKEDCKFMQTYIG